MNFVSNECSSPVSRRTECENQVGLKESQDRHHNLSEISFQDLIDMVLQVFNIILNQELKRHRFVVPDEAIIGQSGFGD